MEVGGKRFTVRRPNQDLHIKETSLFRVYSLFGTLFLTPVVIVIRSVP